MYCFLPGHHFWHRSSLLLHVYENTKLHVYIKGKSMCSLCPHQIVMIANLLPLFNLFDFLKATGRINFNKQIHVNIKYMLIINNK